MQTNRRKLVLAALAAAACTGVTGVHAQAADYPDHPIKIIVPFGPGSGADSATRYFGERLGKELGQGIIVENRPGGSGIVGLQALKNLPADGYTLIMASNSPMAVNPFVIKDLPYDSMTDFRPVYGLTRTMNVILVSNQSPYKTLADLLAAGRKKPLSMGTYSAGYELAGQWLAQLSGSKFTNVAYKGQSAVITDLIGNQLDFAQVDLGGSFELLRGKKLRALAVTGEARNPEAPGVPTVRESGFPDYVQYSWTSFYVRAQTPDDIVNKLASAVQKIIDTGEARDYVRRVSVELMAYPPQEMARFHRAEIERFRQIAEKAGIKPQ